MLISRLKWNLCLLCRVCVILSRPVGVILIAIRLLCLLKAVTWLLKCVRTCPVSLEVRLSTLAAV